jgi:tetratricopeptide (TPR) repeat protein
LALETQAGQVPPDRGPPDAEGCRAAIARVLASTAFQSSPKLAAFLRFVVDAALSGRSDRIKGYTIGTEALGRGKDFDPQSDPIVRVEAGRLRRTLDAYYAGPGVDDPVIIALPIGSYVPTFTVRDLAPPPSPAQPIEPSHSAGLRARPATLAAVGTALAALAAFGAIHVFVMHPAHDVGVTGSVDRSAAVAATDGALYRTARAAPSVASLGPSRSPGFGLPTVYVRPFNVIGGPPTPSSDLVLRDSLIDAFTRFDEIEVRSEPAPAVGATDQVQRSQYELATTAEYAADGAIRLNFRLVDLREHTVVWSRSFDRTPIVRAEVVRELATALVQPYGAIYALERTKRASAAKFNPSYVCLIDSFEAWRSYDVRKEDAVRACLEQTTRADPSFAGGFAALATLHFREYAFGFGAGASDRSVLDRSLAAAQRAVELKPESARAHQALMDAHFFRGELAQAREQGDKAVALNPFDMYVAGDFGMRLVFMGDSATGVALIERFLDNRKAGSSRGDFALFLAAYLAGNDNVASFHAGQITNSRFPLGVLARALAAARGGDHADASRELDHLFALNAGWRDDTRGALKRFFPASEIVDRLAADIAHIRDTAVVR